MNNQRKFLFALLSTVILLLSGCVSLKEIPKIKSTLGSINDYSVKKVSTDANGNQGIRLEESIRGGKRRVEFIKDEIYNSGPSIHIHNGLTSYFIDLDENIAYKDTMLKPSKNEVEQIEKLINELSKKGLFSFFSRYSGLKSEDVDFRGESALKITGWDEDKKNVLYVSKDSWLPLRYEKYFSEKMWKSFKNLNEEFDIMMDVPETVPLRYNTDYLEWEINQGISESRFLPDTSQEIINLNELSETDRGVPVIKLGATDADVEPFETIVPDLSDEFIFKNEKMHATQNVKLKIPYTVARLSYFKLIDVDESNAYDEWDLKRYDLEIKESPSYMILTEYIAIEMGTVKPTMNNYYKEEKTISGIPVKILTYLSVNDFSSNKIFIKNPSTNQLEQATSGKDDLTPLSGWAGSNKNAKARISKSAFFKKGNLLFRLNIFTELSSSTFNKESAELVVSKLEEEIEQDFELIIKRI